MSVTRCAIFCGKRLFRRGHDRGGAVDHGPDINVPYDFFRDRLMFPICDRSGRVIALEAGRWPGCAAQIQEFAGNAAVSQGRQPLQPA